MRALAVATFAAVLVGGVLFFFSLDPSQELESPPKKSASSSFERSSRTGLNNETQEPSSEREKQDSNVKAQEKGSESSSKREELPDWKSVFKIGSLPKNNLTEYVEKLEESKDSHRPGRYEVELYSVAMYCERAPQNKVKLEERKAEVEEAALMEGFGNGEILESVSRIDTHYQECEELEERYDLKGYELLKIAADKGHPAAKSLLASSHVPEGFDSWGKDEKSNYKKKMEEQLNQAREECAPFAFLPYAYGTGEGKLWRDTSGIPENVRKYSNLLALGMIYQNHTSGAGRQLKQIKRQIQSIASKMQSHDVSEAEKYGRYLYSKACD